MLGDPDMRPIEDEGTTSVRDVTQKRLQARQPCKWEAGQSAQLKWILDTEIGSEVGGRPDHLITTDRGGHQCTLQIKVMLRDQLVDTAPGQPHSLFSFRVVTSYEILQKSSHIRFRLITHCSRTTLRCIRIRESAA